MSNKVLVVDDNPKNLQVVAALLTENNYVVEVALNGKTALKWLENTPFDAILLDVMMPEMDGFTTCELIKKNNACVNIPIIFLTARHDIESITDGFSKGGVDYITKPFNQQELLVRLKTHIELKESREKLLDLNGWLQSEVQKKTEELIVANKNLIKAYEELKMLDKAKNDFLNTISHELRTPLNGIVGSINLLNSFDHDTQVSEILALLETSVNNLEKYSYAALQISNLQLKGESQLSSNDVDLIPFVKSQVNTIHSKCQKKNLNLTFKINIPEANVNIDQALMSTAIVSLLESTLIYTNEGEIKVEISVNNDHAIIEIVDTGSLYAGTELKHFFNSVKNQNYQFERNHAIELYLARIIILLHNGELELSNRSDSKGAITIIKLPLVN
ncbi:hybrid sensor histidine kinase/response regulator [Plebeiibacterium sediminum]|uniref:histidine kinase n=1 Tax=Plebeiibacterium sediminum TaxID=2992112 RepID=A0AAE3M1A3_9BACT|nr:hybrid sensor histidine kinase/response regulator [Plebeiobacterium sediminum]MCW3785061.1 hybrid sensor histidine kinase/response regulator [Plebeiobacterium sediminum]